MFLGWLGVFGTEITQILETKAVSEGLTKYSTTFYTKITWTVLNKWSVFEYLQQLNIYNNYGNEHRKNQAELSMKFFVQLLCQY